MGKLLFWIVLIALAWAALRLLERHGRNLNSTTSTNLATESSEPMLQCSLCGVHFPASEAVADGGGRQYCSQAHHDSAWNDARS